MAMATARKSIVLAPQWTVVAEWAGWAREVRENVDKVWAACYTSDGMFLSVWGRRGTRLNITTKQFKSADAAAVWYAKKIKEKRVKGYSPLPFSQSDSAVAAIQPDADGYYRFTGGLPSFFIDNNPYIAALRDKGAITWQSIAKEARRLDARLRDIVSSDLHWADLDLPGFLADFQINEIRFAMWLANDPDPDDVADMRELMDLLSRNVEAMLLTIEA